MDLLSIMKIVAPLAPVAASIAGGLVGGPAGAAAAGGLAKIILGKFGLPETATASQLSDRIAEAGEETSRARINAAMEQARAEIQGFVDVERATLEAMVRNATDVNVTMRAELTSNEHWFYKGWRPAFGWMFGIVWGAFGLMLTVVTAKTTWTAPDPIGALNAAWPLFAAFFIPGAAVLGVLIPSRSYEKGQALKVGAPMPNAQPITTTVPPLLPKVATVPLPTKPRVPPADRPQTGGG